MGRIVKADGMENVCGIIAEAVKGSAAAIVYSEGEEKTAGRMIDALKKHGVTIAFSLSSRVQDLKRVKADYLIGIGSEDTDALLSADGRKWCMLCALPRLRMLISAKISRNNGFRARLKYLPQCYIVDISREPGREELADLLGEVSALYQVALDYKLQGYICGSEIASEETIKKADRILTGPKLGYEEITDAAILACEIIDNRLLTFAPATFIAAELLAADRGISYGDACLLCAMCYIYTAYTLLGSSMRPVFPVEKTRIATDISALSGIDMNTALRALGVIPHEVIINNDYVIREFSPELKKFIAERFKVLNNICVQWRRLKGDVGRKASRAVSIKEILNIVSEISLIGNGYGVIRHYKELGAV